MKKKIIAIASDHAGLELKEKLEKALEGMGYSVIDFGTNSKDSVDYPDYAEKVSQSIIGGESDMGVLVCGSGIGMSIAANRHTEVRAALCHNEESAKLARQHNDANILALGARTISAETAMKCLKTFFNTDFEGGRHKRRVDKLS